MSVPTFDLMTVPEADRERVAALIPHPDVAEQYIHRSIKGVYDFDIMDGATTEEFNVILDGPTGSAKTTFFRAYAASRGLPIAIIQTGVSFDKSTVVGQWVKDDDGKMRWIDGKLTLVARYGGIILIDDINMVHPRALAAFYDLLAVTRSMDLPEHSETIFGGMGGTGERQPLLLVAAYNPRYDGTVRLNAALLRRYAVKLPWGYDRATEEQLIPSARLLDLAWEIRGMEEIRTDLSTATLVDFVRFVEVFGSELAFELFVNNFAVDERGPVSRALEGESQAIVAEIMAANDELVDA